MTGRTAPPPALLVVSFASSALLEQNIVPLTRSRPGLQVVVVDNRTTEAEAEAVRRLAEREGWVALLNADNAGFGAAMNRAAHEAIGRGAGSLLLLNPDASISSDSLDVLLGALDDRTLVAPLITRSDGSVWSRGSDLSRRDGRVWGRARRPAGADVMEWLTGACLLISAAHWQRIGGFDDNYFLYWEDIDLSWKVQQAGGTLRLITEAVAIHDAGGTQGAGSAAGLPKSELYYYFNIRNRLVYAGLRLPASQRRAWWRRTPAVVSEVLRIGGRRHLLSTIAPWRAAVHGVIDGWAMQRSIVRHGHAEPPRTEARLRAPAAR